MYGNTASRDGSDDDGDNTRPNPTPPSKPSTPKGTPVPTPGPPVTRGLRSTRKGTSTSIALAPSNTVTRSTTKKTPVKPRVVTTVTSTTRANDNVTTRPRGASRLPTPRGNEMRGLAHNAMQSAEVDESWRTAPMPGPPPFVQGTPTFSVTQYGNNYQNTEDQHGDSDAADEDDNTQDPSEMDLDVPAALADGHNMRATGGGFTSHNVNRAITQATTPSTRRKISLAPVTGTPRGSRNKASAIFEGVAMPMPAGAGGNSAVVTGNPADLSDDIFYRPSRSNLRLALTQNLLPRLSALESETTIEVNSAGVPLSITPIVLGPENNAKIDREVRWHEFLYHSRLFHPSIIRKFFGPVNVNSERYTHIKAKAGEEHRNYKSKTLGYAQEHVAEIIRRDSAVLEDTVENTAVIVSAIERSFHDTKYRSYHSVFRYMKGAIDIEKSTPLGQYYCKSVFVALCTACIPLARAAAVNSHDGILDMKARLDSIYFTIPCNPAFADVDRTQFVHIGGEMVNQDRPKYDVEALIAEMNLPPPPPATRTTEKAVWSPLTTPFDEGLARSVRQSVEGRSPTPSSRRGRGTPTYLQRGRQRGGRSSSTTGRSQLSREEEEDEEDTSENEA